MNLPTYTACVVQFLFMDINCNNTGHPSSSHHDFVEIIYEPGITLYLYSWSAVLLNEYIRLLLVCTLKASSRKDDYFILLSTNYTNPIRTWTNNSLMFTQACMRVKVKYIICNNKTSVWLCMRIVSWTYYCKSISFYMPSTTYEFIRLLVHKNGVACLMLCIFQLYIGTTRCH